MGRVRFASAAGIPTGQQQPATASNSQQQPATASNSQQQPASNTQQQAQVKLRKPAQSRALQSLAEQLIVEHTHCKAKHRQSSQNIADHSFCFACFPDYKLIANIRLHSANPHMLTHRHVNANPRSANSRIRSSAVLQSILEISGARARDIWHLLLQALPRERRFGVESYEAPWTAADHGEGANPHSANHIGVDMHMLNHIALTHIWEDPVYANPHSSWPRVWKSFLNGLQAQQSFARKPRRSAQMPRRRASPLCGRNWLLLLRGRKQEI